MHAAADDVYIYIYICAQAQLLPRHSMQLSVCRCVMHKNDGGVKWFVKAKHLESAELLAKLNAIADKWEKEVSQLQPRLNLKQHEVIAAKRAAAVRAAGDAATVAAAAAPERPPLPAAAAEQRGDSSDEDDGSGDEDDPGGKGKRGGMKLTALTYMVAGKHMDVRRAVYKVPWEV